MFGKPFFVREVGSQKLENKSQQLMSSIESLLIAWKKWVGEWGGYGDGEVFYLKLTLCKNGKEIKEKNPPLRQSIFRRPSNPFHVNYGSKSSSNNWFYAIARRDGHLAQKGQVNLENVLKQNSNKRRISDSPVIAIVSKLARHESRSLGLPPLSGSISKSIRKVPI